MNTSQPDAGRPSAAGPPVSPHGPLLAWLNDTAQADPTRMVRLPVVVWLDSRRLGIASAAVGTDPGDDPADAPLQLILNDTAMGVSLLRQLDDHLAGDRTGCAVWLDGHWGRPGGSFRQEEAGPDSGLSYLFSPQAVHGPVSPGRSPHQAHAALRV